MYEAGRFTAASAASLVPCIAFSSVGSVGAATVKISCVLLSFSSELMKCPLAHYQTTTYNLALSILQMYFADSTYD